MSGSSSVMMVRRILQSVAMAGLRVRRRRERRPGLVENLEARQLLSAVSKYQVESRPAPREGAAGTGLSSSSTPVPASAPLNQTFLLNSRPGATKTIYLDFDGHTTSGTPWNALYTSGTAFTTPAFTLDGDSTTFTNTELTAIQEIWARVAEDFAPFDVNVTTQDPGVDSLIRSGVGDTRWGIRCVIGGDDNEWYDSPASGVALQSTFGSATDIPCFNFSLGQFGSLLDIADTASHEIGHTLGLSHDGDLADEYYGGHGTGNVAWAPIMGAGFGIPVSQWSKGEYPGANNLEDDFAIIASTANGFSLRVDDYGSNRLTASQMTSTKIGSVRRPDVSGVIERATDQDWFVFTTTGGLVSLDFGNADAGANLDIAASLYDLNGTLLLTSNPATELFAAFSVNLPAGTYYVMIDGVGAGNLATGYSDYGSVGQYTITGAIPDTSTGNPNVGTSVIAGRIVSDANADGILNGTDAGIHNVVVFIDVDGNGTFKAGIDKSARTDAAGNFRFTGLQAGVYAVYQVVPSGWQQISPVAAGQLVAVNANSTSNVLFRNVRPPLLSGFGSSTTYKTGSAPILLAANANVADADTTNFAGGRLTVALGQNAQATDVLSIRNQGNGAGQVGFFGGFVRFGGVGVGNVSGGISGSSLVITFNSNATLAAVRAIMRNLTFRANLANPAKVTRAITYSLTDGKGGISQTIANQVKVT